MLKSVGRMFKLLVCARRYLVKRCRSCKALDKISYVFGFRYILWKILRIFAFHKQFFFVFS